MSVNGKLPGIGSYERTVIGRAAGKQGERRKVMEAGLEEGEENRKGGGSMGARETRRGHEKTETNWSKYVSVEKRYVRVGGEKTQLPAAGRDTNMASPVL